MDDECPPSPSSLVVNSPRRTLSLLRERRATVSISDPNEKALEFARHHGPKPSEVYGFVGSITTVIATVIYLVWAYTPEPWLHSLGITYYPSKYWALAIPAFAMVTLVLGMVFYLGLNFMVTPPPTSFYTMFGFFLLSLDRWTYLGSNIAFPKARPPVIGERQVDMQASFTRLSFGGALWSSRRHKGSQNGIK